MLVNSGEYEVEAGGRVVKDPPPPTSFSTAATPKLLGEEPRTTQETIQSSKANSNT